jgi:hypothetical protein
MAGKVKIAALRKWKIELFLHNLAYCPDINPPRSESLESLGLIDAQLNIDQTGSKASLVYHPRYPKKQIWAVLGVRGLGVTSFWGLDERNGSIFIPVHDPDMRLFPTKPLMYGTAELKALLYYLFLDCGATDELVPYHNFYPHLEGAFRRHIAEEKKREAEKISARLPCGDNDAAYIEDVQ